MWLVRTKWGQLIAVMIVYFNDIAVFGPRTVAERVAEAVRSKWKTSTAMWPSPEEPVSFCGMEVARLNSGWRVTQTKYLREVLKRYEIEGSVCGAILWSVTCTRPHLMFVAARMSQYSTKSPVAVVEWERQALKYVSLNLVSGVGVEGGSRPNAGRA